MTECEAVIVNSHLTITEPCDSFTYIFYRLSDSGDHKIAMLCESQG